MQSAPLKKMMLAAALAAFTGLANANFVELIPGNDCSGVFGTGFANCKIPTRFDPNESPIIIKFNVDDDGKFLAPEINGTLFPTITGSEFTFSDLDSDLGTGTWTYTPGAGDPAIHWFVAKAANNFNLFSNLGDPNSDSWVTPLNQHDQPRGLSHISFFDTGSSPGGDSRSVPEPSSSGLAVLGIGLLGATFWKRRRSPDA
jgi:hypothetical protein